MMKPEVVASAAHEGRDTYLLSVGLTEASVSILIRSDGAALGTHAVLQHVSLHALQAVGSQRAFTGVAAPVTFWEQDRGNRRGRVGNIGKKR